MDVDHYSTFSQGKADRTPVVIISLLRTFCVYLGPLDTYRHLMAVDTCLRTLGV